MGWRKQRLRVSLLVLVRREIVHVLRDTLSQARLTLSYARREEDVGWHVDRATRENEGPALSGESCQHRGRRHRLTGYFAGTLRAACMSAGGAHARARGGARARRIIYFTHEVY